MRTGSQNTSAVDQEISAMWGEVCAAPKFVGLYDQWGAHNFTFGLYGNVNGVVYANFTIAWYNWSAGKEYVTQVNWCGTIATDVVSGPITSVEPVGGSGGAPGTSGPGTSGSILPTWVELVAIGAAVVGAIAFVSLRGRHGGGGGSFDDGPSADSSADGELSLSGGGDQGGAPASDSLDDIM
jgi:hypothetical protein